ncbi:hypothetical protein Goshw_020192, partial [Gossypium schwendimanii]|nr:hypothetical protein [Gossypium schwendimanii]
FCSGLEVANFVVSSGLLKLSWAKILDCYGGFNLNELQNLGLSIKWKAYLQANINILVFTTSPICTKSHLQDSKQLVSSTAFKESFPVFEFLCNNGNSFSIHKAAIALFADHFHELLQLKAECGRNSNSLIVTGHSLGGSVASLFTLWLLESLDISLAKRPLCLTFGSPLVGDKGFQQAISQHPAWNSCFLHVAATSKDSIPRLFIAPRDLNSMDLDSKSDDYKPFGTFLLCCEDGCTWSENPEAVSELLMAVETEDAGNEEWTINVYSRIIEQLESMIVRKGISQVNESILNSLRAGTTLQTEAIRIRNEQLLIKKLEELEEICMFNKGKAFDPAKKLNVIKIKMAELEWYKKVAKANETGYYDCYKKQLSRRDRDVIKHKKFLTNYWKEVVAQNERKPQKQLVYLRSRWLYAGTTYRRMVEPLDIADYYRYNGSNYVTNGRSHHYIKLEQWLEEEKQSRFWMDTKKQNVDVILTDDSCFWAHVEEARLWCKSLKTADVGMISERVCLRQKLMEFEVYVMEQIKKYAVSSEIFLKGSSFMQWWKEYEMLIEPHHNSPLTDFIRNCKFQQYASGCLVLN